MGRWEQPWRGGPYNWFAQASVSYQSSEYLDASLDPRSFQSGYALYDAIVGFQPASHAWRFSIWGKNLGGKRYYVAEAPQTQAGNVSAGGTQPVNGFIGWLGIPRTYGVELSAKF